MAGTLLAPRLSIGTAGAHPCGAATSRDNDKRATEPDTRPAGSLALETRNGSIDDKKAKSGDM